MKKGMTPLFFILLLMGSCEKSSDHLCVENQELNYPIIAHSHNDYEQTFPILTALNYGFKSLEVDVVFDGSNIKVSHDLDNLNEKELFEDSYLLPLTQEIRSISSEIFLLIDVKHYTDELFQKLTQTLLKYEEFLISRNGASNENRKIKIILSGDIPKKLLIENDSNEYIFIDGRLNEFDLNASSSIVPIISIDFSDISNWPNRHIFSDEVKSEMNVIINLVHKKNKLIRFWNTKDKESVWLKLIDLNVDIIGVDDPGKFCEIMNKNGLTK